MKKPKRNPHYKSFTRHFMTIHPECYPKDRKETPKLAKIIPFNPQTQEVQK